MLNVKIQHNLDAAYSPFCTYRISSNPGPAQVFRGTDPNFQMNLQNFPNFGNLFWLQSEMRRFFNQTWIFHDFLIFTFIFIICFLSVIRQQNDSVTHGKAWIWSKFLSHLSKITKRRARIAAAKRCVNKKYAKKRYAKKAADNAIRSFSKLRQAFRKQI